jgi:hypothetical protein
MICLRCGYCCSHHWVILPDGTPHNGVEDGDCKFLTREEDGKAMCSIHGQTTVIVREGKKHRYKWKDTPCGRHGQIERSTADVCRMGEYQLKEAARGGRLRGQEPMTPASPGGGE